MAAPKDSNPEGTSRRKRSAKPALVVASVLGHVALLVGLGEIEVPELHAATSIEVFEAKEKPKPPPPAKVEPPPPLEKPEPRANRKTAPTPQAAPPPEAPAPQASLSDLPELGLELGNGPGGPGGVAVAAPAPRGPAPRSTVARSLGPTTNAKPALADECSEPAAKPKPLTTPQPAYTDQARAAGVEGKVRVQLVVDENGAVVEARVLAGLGHGLDEAALAAARSWTFSPAVRCGRPSRATFTVAMRFTAS